MSLTCLPNVFFLTDNAKDDFSPTPLNSNFKLVESESVRFYGIAVLNSGDAIVPRSETPEAFADNRKNRVLCVVVVQCRQWLILPGKMNSPKGEIREEHVADDILGHNREAFHDPQQTDLHVGEESG